MKTIILNHKSYLSVDEIEKFKKEIEKIAYQKFGNLEGIAQQYLFYWKRDA